MLAWPSLCILILAALFTLVVVRLSEISTRMYTLEQATERIVHENSVLALQTSDYVTHSELHVLLRHSSPPYFTVGRPPTTQPTLG